MNPTKHQELLDFWEYEHGFDNEDGATSIDEDISYEASRQELQIELEHFNEMDLDQELHPIKDDDFQPEDEHSNKTMLKRELRAIACTILFHCKIIFYFILLNRCNKCFLCSSAIVLS